MSPESLTDTLSFSTDTLAADPATRTAISAPQPDLTSLVVPLLKGVLYREDDATQWSALLQLQARVRDYVAVLALELVVDEAEGYAFLRSQPQSDEAAPKLPRLVRRQPLSFSVSLLLALLRKKLAEFDASGGDTRLILTRSAVVELVRVFLPTGSNESRLIDVRNWFVFAASERWREDMREHEHYSDSGGKSGGQKEKLAYTILAASLAYQFGLAWGETRSKSFRFVVIDEAFGRGSDESAQYGLQLFEKLNLQLLIVTPLQKIHIIEPFVASVGFVHNFEGRDSRLRNLSIEEYRKEKGRVDSVDKSGSGVGVVSALTTIVGQNGAQE